MFATKKLKAIDEQELIQLIHDSSSKREVLRKLQIGENNSQAMKYLHSFYKKHALKQTPRMLLNLNKAEFSAILEKSFCWSDILILLNIKDIGSNRNYIKELVSNFDLSIEHFDMRKSINFKSRSRISLDDFQENSSKSRGSIKSLILRKNIIPYKCSKCNNDGKWLNESLTLQLDHINGIYNDHRLENLCFLCPNCHSQSSTFAGRNANSRVFSCDASRQKLVPWKKVKKPKQGRKTRIEWPELEQLTTLVWEMPMTTLSTKLGVSDRAIRKRCKKLNIPVPNSGHWIKKENKS